MKASEFCPCGSGALLDDCCGRWLGGNAEAPTAEALMRSRYTAYVLEKYDYLLKTWHSTTRPEKDALGGTSLHWIGLDIVRTEQGKRQDTSGAVEFIANYVHESTGNSLHELSRFVREGKRWLYVDGDCRVSHIGRNDTCPCGSGRKFKHCCSPGYP